MDPDSYRDLIHILLLAKLQDPLHANGAGFLFICTMDYIVYILHSEKLNRFYTGATSDIDVRLHFHKNAEAHKYTHKADDWILMFTIACDNKSQMLGIEQHIKKMKSKTYIQNLIQYPEMVSKLKIQYPG